MRVVMVMFRADGQRRSFSVTRDITVIGRREDCDLRIPLGDVSRKHCRVLLDGDVIRVEDLGSSNGTFRNGERVQQTELTAGDTLQVGPVVFCVQVDGVPAEDELQPVTVQSLAAAAASKPAEAASRDVTTTPNDEPQPVEESLSAGDFDPMEALESAEGSAFDFQIDESQHGAPVDLEESGQDQVV
jgi:pSer/pThr/pTyr-binding forkhead associated (FHA) protein